jgi:hypothetical protein
VLYLFSSNVQPLYVQNVLNFIASPRGAHHMLRYDETWVACETRDAWSNNQLTGKPALLHFSLQHPEQFIEPAFIPIRAGVVHRSWKEGSVYFVKVEMRDDVALKPPAKGIALEPWEEGHADARQVKAYTRLLDEQEIPHPYPSSAAWSVDHREQAKDLVDFDLSPPDALRRHVRFLASIESFSETRFVRLLALRDVDADSAVRMTKDDPPAYALVGGRTYRAEFFSYEPKGITSPSRFELTADDTVVTFVGYAGFEIASRYDRPEVLVHTATPANGQTLRTVLAVRPSAGVRGPRLDLPISVKAKWRSAVLASVLSALVLGLLAAAAMVQSDARYVLAAGGAAVGIVMQLLGLAVPGLVAPVQSVVKPASPPPAGPTPGQPGASQP